MKMMRYNGSKTRNIQIWLTDTPKDISDDIRTTFTDSDT